MKLKTIFYLVSLLVFLGCKQGNKEERLTSYVDPFIGTGAHGHVFPGASTPLGMVQLSPVNGISGWDWCSGYHSSSTELVGFAHMCLSGTGIGDLADLLVLPTSQAVVSDTTERGRRFIHHYKATYSHDDEVAEPGYYSVNLLEDGVQAELTASKRVGFHKYTFSKGSDKSLIIDLGYAINWDKATDTYIKKENDTRFVGYRKSAGWAKEQWLYFVIETNLPVANFQVVTAGEVLAQDELVAKDAKGILSFDNVSDEPIYLKVGLSSASIDGARKSIDVEMPGWDFAEQRQKASDLWEQELRKITIETAEEDLKTIFYTSLYHSLMAPYVHSDLNGEYKGLNGKVNKAEGFERYTVFSLWDTFRASHPLFTMVQADKVRDFVHSFMAIYREGGLLPVWELLGNETNCMIGYHAIPVIADAWQKGLLKGMNGHDLLDAMVASGMSEKAGLAHYREYGYMPADLENESVSKALEYAYDDWCIAQMAKSLGNDEVYQQFIERAAYYQNHFDASTGFMRGKLANGEWKKDFDPLYSAHRNDEYVEGNAWQYSWFVPHDMRGLIDLHDGDDNFITKLDSLFTINESVKGEHASPDISGLIGQYAHGNEPSHHVAYAYNYAGQQWKTAERTNNIMRTLYSSELDGLCGNEDCGQMSAWYVLSSLGFYPVNPAEGIYLIGSPQFDKAKIAIGNGKFFTIKTDNNSISNIYVQGATLNGKKLSRSWFTHEEMMQGGELTLLMGAIANKQWGVTNLPPSMSDQ